MARSFNGSRDYITADGANVAAMNAPFTVAAWLIAAGSVTDKDWYGEGRSVGTNPFLQMQTNAGKLRVYLRQDFNASSPDVSAVSALTVADGTPHHVVYTQDGSGNYQCYVDGAADSSAQGFYTTHPMTVDRVTFGALRRTSLSSQWPGTLWELATFTRELSAGEAQSLASGLPAAHLAPDHYWPLWGRDSPEPDLGTASHVTGTINGTPAHAPGGRVGLGLLRLST